MSNSATITAKETEICIQSRDYDLGGTYLHRDNCHYIIKVGDHLCWYTFYHLCVCVCVSVSVIKISQEWVIETLFNSHRFIIGLVAQTDHYLTLRGLLLG